MGRSGNESISTRQCSYQVWIYSHNSVKRGSTNTNVQAHCCLYCVWEIFHINLEGGDESLRVDSVCYVEVSSAEENTIRIKSLI